MEEKMTVLVVEPQKTPYVKEIDTGLESLQKAVGGDIQAVYPWDEPVSLICGEESKINGEPLNRALRDEDGHIYDVVAGTFLITGLGEDNFCSLSDEHIRKFTELFRIPEMFMKIDGKLAVLPLKLPEEKRQSGKHKISMYPHSVTYAREHGEMEEYSASRKATLACKEAIEDSIREHYSDNYLHEGGAKKMIDTFGAERVAAVLAVTCIRRNWDGRISDRNKEWAKSVPLTEDIDRFGEDRNLEFALGQTHSGLVDLFVREFRQETAKEKTIGKTADKAKRPSVLAQLKNPLPAQEIAAPKKKETVR